MAVKQTRRKTPLEEEIHEAIIKQIDALRAYNQFNYPIVLRHHSPNEGKNNNNWRFKMARMGMISGFPDIAIFWVKDKEIHAGFLEVKRNRRSKLSEKQEYFYESLGDARFTRYKVVYCIADAEEALRDWGVLK